MCAKRLTVPKTLQQEYMQTLPLPSRILVTDAHPLILEGMRRLLEQMPEVQSIDTATSAGELLRQMSNHPYDLFVLDIGLDDGDGLDLIPAIRQNNGQAGILVCTTQEEIWTVHRMLKANPDSIVLKLSETEHIRQAVQALQRGERYYCPRFEKLRRQLAATTPALLKKNRPTPREQEVLRHIAAGMNTVEIAARLHLTENTIESYRKNLMMKLEARNAADLIVKALQKGYLDLRLG